MESRFPGLAAAWPPAYPLHQAVAGDVARALDATAEASYGVPSVVLMEHASAGVAAVACLMTPAEARIVVLCGPGNNGGDGYGAARFLASWGRHVHVLCCSRRPPQRGDAASEVAWCEVDVPSEDAWARPERVGEVVGNADLVIDALFGVGLDRALDAPFTDWILATNASAGLRLAVDVPSGLDADTGQLRPVAVLADVTATMAMPKTGLVAAHAGQIVEIDIGLPGPVHRPYLRSYGP